MEGASRNEVKPTAIRQRRYSKEKLAQRGQALYEYSIRQQVGTGNEGKIVEIDIDACLETSNFDHAARSLKTDIKFSEEVCLPKN
jgi:hypothetical protein